MFGDGQRQGVAAVVVAIVVEVLEIVVVGHVVGDDVWHFNSMVSMRYEVRVACQSSVFVVYVSARPLSRHCIPSIIGALVLIELFRLLKSIVPAKTTRIRPRDHCYCHRRRQPG